MLRPAVVLLAQARPLTPAVSVGIKTAGDNDISEYWVIC
jgi:hypothetical protein